MVCELRIKCFFFVFFHKLLCWHKVASLTKWNIFNFYLAGERTRNLFFLFIFSHFYYHIIILVYFTVGSTSSGSAFVIAPKLSLSGSHFEDDSSPYISWSGSPIGSAILFKDVTLTWINYLETWLRSDNTSCYYIMLSNKLPFPWKSF